MFQLVIEACPQAHAEPLSELLEALGALSITMTDQHDCPILEPELGTAPLWPQVVIRALYMTQPEAQAALELAKRQPNNALQCNVETVPEQDWQRACMADFKPQQFGERLWICPSWSTPPVPDAVNLILDPGLAFGTGTHPTTSLCLRWLEQAHLTQKRLIDYGCGSGILALAALKLGAASVDAVDIDEQALIATRQNAQDNRIPEENLRVDYPDELNNPVDILLANILLAPLLTLKARFKQLICTNGTLVVSGILEDQAPSLIETYQPEFKHCETSTENGWAMLVFERD